MPIQNLGPSQIQGLVLIQPEELTLSVSFTVPEGVQGSLFDVGIAFSAAVQNLTASDFFFQGIAESEIMTTLDTVDTANYILHVTVSANNQAIITPGLVANFSEN